MKMSEINSLYKNCIAMFLGFDTTISEIETAHQFAGFRNNCREIEITGKETIGELVKMYCDHVTGKIPCGSKRDNLENEVSK